MALENINIGTKETFRVREEIPLNQKLPANEVNEIVTKTNAAIARIDNNEDKVYAPDGTTVVAKGLSNNLFNLSEKTAITSKSYTLLAGEGIDLVFPKSNIHYVIKYRISGSFTTSSETIGSVCGAITLFTRDTGTVQFYKNDVSSRQSNGDFKIGIGNVRLEDDLFKLTISNNSATNTINSVISLEIDETFGTQNQIAISSIYTPAVLPAVANVSEVKAHIAGATGLPIYESADGLTFSRIAAGHYRIEAGDFTAIKSVIPSSVDDATNLSNANFVKTSDTQWEVYTYDLTAFALADYDYTAEITVE